MTGTIQVQEPVQLEEYGDREEIKELGFRLQQMMPGAQRFNQSEALAVAQIAVAHDLNPFNGEVWGIKGNGKWYGVMVGIKGLRKEARRQIREEGGSYWLDFQRVDTSKYDEPESSIVYECHLRDSVTLTKWKGIVHELNDVMDYEQAVESAGPAPVYVGIGVVEANERSKMHKHALAKKRAEADAIKKRFDVEFKGARYDARYVDAEGPMIVNGEYKDASPQIYEPKSSGKTNEEQLLAEIGYDIADMPDVGVVEDQDEDPAWDGDGVVSPEKLKEVLELNAEMYAGQKAQPQHRKMLANYLNTTFDGSKEKRYEWSEYYLGSRSTSKIKDKLILATLKTFLECQNWGDLPNPSAVKSIKQSHSYALKQLGQQEMEL
jgi:hypothetical protein